MAEIGSIKGVEKHIIFKTPKTSVTYMCSSNQNYITWTKDLGVTGYIIYKNGVEIYNATIFELYELYDSGNMFNPCDHNTNLFSRTRDKFMFIDTDIKKTKEYTYSVRAYKTMDNGETFLSELSNEFTIKCE